jgi:Ca2+:H+ antiporter
VKKTLNILLIFVPVAFAAKWLYGSPLLVFLTSALAIVPLAGLLGDATESLAVKTGPRIGGLLNATFGNAAELIIAIMAVQSGQLTLVSASLIGSILGNILLVLGMAILFGGFRFGTQRFDKEQAGLDAALLFLATIALVVPSLFNAAIEPATARVEGLSTATAVVMLLIYLLATGYSLFKSRHSANDLQASSFSPKEGTGTHRWSSGMSLVVLVLSVAVLAVLSEFLVAAVKPVTEQLGFSAFFIGIIILPIIGNVAEHVVAVEVGMKNHLDLSLSIALGSSLQIALFVAPLVVLLSPLLGHAFVLEFNPFELIALTSAVVIGAFVAVDGKSNWLEGAMLLAVYLILSIGFFFLPGKM